MSLRARRGVAELLGAKKPLGQKKNKKKQKLKRWDVFLVSLKAHPVHAVDTYSRLNATSVGDFFFSFYNRRQREMNEFLFI